MSAGTIIIGLMSGTSADGIDAAAVRFTGPEERPGIELPGFVTLAYSDAMRGRLLELAEGRGSPAELSRVNVALGELLAEAASAVIERAELEPGDVSLVGSHGHTISHTPQPGDATRSGATLQTGEAAVIAEALGITVVSDFRVRDVAAGGQGAPLVPIFDLAFVASPEVGRVALNIGGIANATVLPAGCGSEDVVAFDTGPGNMPIDAAVRLVAHERGRFDADGELAAAGTVRESLVEALLKHPYFARRPPKTCGREQFGEGFVRSALDEAPGIAPGDFVASITELCGRATGRALARFAALDAPREIIVSGGGAHNPTLLASVERHAGMRVRPSDELGIPVDAKEAMAFAYLALRTSEGRAGNVPAAIGAGGPRVLGKITPA